MKKSACTDSRYWLIRKTILIMKISTFFLLIALQVSATNYAQNLNIKGKDIALTDLFAKIEKQSAYRFYYSNDVLPADKYVSVNVVNANISEILTEVLKNSNLQWKLIDKNRVVVFSNTLKVINNTNVAIGKIMGTVMDDQGKPLDNVSVIVKGSTIGTITNAAGQFSINVVDGKSILVISRVGYETKEISAADATVIVLQATKGSMDEVIVVGYGTSTKKSLISSVSTVKTDQLGSLPITNITQGLAGRAPGLIVQAAGGGIGKTSKISIRGGSQGSPQGDPSPLVVIDGIIRSYEDFIMLNPDDIEQFSILKDASAAAVYGSRASNGILQVTTKKGKVGAAQVDYSFNYSIAQPSIWPKPFGALERAQYANIAKKNDGDATPVYTDDVIQKIKDGSDLEHYANTNWRDLVFNKYAPQKKHNIRLTGGTETNNYYLSLGYIDQQSLYKSGNHNMQRYNYRLSQTSLIKSIGLKIIATIDGFIQKQTHPYTSTSSSYYQVFSHVQNRSPLDNGVNSFGLPLRGGDNPVAETALDAGYTGGKTNVVNGNLALEWAVPWVKGLKLRTTGNYRYNGYVGKNWRKDPAQYEWASKDPISSTTAPELNVSNYSSYKWTMQYFADYAKSFGQHNFNVLGGYEVTYGFESNYGLSRTNYQFPIDQISAGPVVNMKNSGSEAEEGRAGYVGQLKYNYANKYFVEGNLRYDGSDLFPKDRRWGTFFSGVAGWSIIDENFMNVVKDKGILNALKIRASYGQVGLDNIGRYAYLSSYDQNPSGYVINGEYVPTFSEGGLPSPAITWYTSTQSNIGVDFATLKDKLYGSAEYFFNETSGYLTAPNPLTVGYTDPLGVSLPKIKSDTKYRKAGFEFRLGYRNNIGDFKYDVSANLTKFDALMAKNAEEAIENVMNPYKRTSQQVGYAGIMYKNLGFYTSAEDVLNSPKRNGSTGLTAGDIKYYDFNGDGKLDAADQIRSGKNSFPRANYGILFNLSYKGFFLNTLFQGATRFDMYLSGVTRAETGQTGSMLIIYPYQTNYWTPNNTNAVFPRLMYNSGVNGGNNYVSSDFWLINGAYLRWKDFQFGYDFKKILLSKSKFVSKVNISISGQNIFTISKATKYGLDPENASVQNYAYPQERMYALNLNIGF